jgi:hypothetical protein
MICIPERDIIMSNEKKRALDGYRIHYDLDALNLSGAMDIPVEDKLKALELFWERIRNKFGEYKSGDEVSDDDVDITRIEAKTFQICKACGNPMGNLGLIYDECLREECSLYLQDQRTR